MKKHFLFITVLLIVALATGCRSGGNAGYDPKADATAQLDTALMRAQQQNKNVVVQVGGSWCPWCVRLHKMLASDTELKARVAADYVWVQIYYGRDNKNELALARLGDLSGYGFPVLVVLSPSGDVLYKQNTGELEEGEGYSKTKLLAFMDQYKEVALERQSAEIEQEREVEDVVGTLREEDSAQRE